MENKKRLNMEKSIVKYLGNFRVEATYETSGQTLTTDAGKVSGGLGEYATPADILAQSLAACALTTIAMRAFREHIDLTGTYAEVGEIVENPETMKIERIDIDFHVKGALDDKMRKKVEQFAHKGCYVGNSLTTEKNFTFMYED